jgi:AmiR/NasT family two-component response regulator
VKTENPLRIIVADDEPDMRLFLREVLPHLGHQVVAEAATGRELLERCRSLHPDLVITDIKMPDMDGLSAAAEVNRTGSVPVILITAHHEAEILDRVGADYIMAYLAKPVKPIELEAAVRLAMVRFAHAQAIAREAADLRQALEDRKLIERAKGAVMRRLRLEEDEAFRCMRKLASDHNQKLAQLANQIVAAEETFRQLDRL